MIQCDRCDEYTVEAFAEFLGDARLCEECVEERKAEAEQRQRESEDILQAWDDFYRAFYLGCEGVLLKEEAETQNLPRVLCPHGR